MLSRSSSSSSSSSSSPSPSSSSSSSPTSASPIIGDEQKNDPTTRNIEKASPRIQWEELLFGGLGAACAGLFTNPLEVIKTRIQLQGELRARGHYTVHYRGTFHAFAAIAKAESVISLQKGLVPALWYQFVMNGLRFGTYQMFDNHDFIRDPITRNVIWYRSIAASVCSGALGTFVSNPFFLIKVQLQSRSTSSASISASSSSLSSILSSTFSLSKLSPNFSPNQNRTDRSLISSVAVGHQHSHRSMTQAFHRIFARHGCRGLWRGSSAAILRCAIGGSLQLTSFATVKSYIEYRGLADTGSWTCTLISSAIGGFLVSAAMTPFDVIATRVLNQDTDRRTGRGKTYAGILDCVRQMLRTEGALAFYKGFAVSFVRLGPHTVLSIFFWQLARDNLGPRFVAN